MFVQPIILDPSDIALPNTNPASVSFETAFHLSTFSANRAAARTSSLLDPQLASNYIQPAPKTRYFIVPATACSDLIAYLAIITVAAMSFAPDINTFIKGCQFQTVTAPPPSAHHPATPLLQYLASSGLPAATVKPWYLDTVWDVIHRGPHTPTHNPASKAFCRADLAERVYRGFRLLLTAETAVSLFGRSLHISRLASDPQTNRKDRLICDSIDPPPDGSLLLPPLSQDNPSVNVSTESTVVPPSMQFGPCLTRLLQQIWEADPQDGPVYLSKWYISDAFHCCVLRPADVGVFSYVVPPLSSVTLTYLCVELVLSMGWVRSLPFVCADYNTAADFANGYMDGHRSPTPEYGPSLGF